MMCSYKTRRRGRRQRYKCSRARGSCPVSYTRVSSPTIDGVVDGNGVDQAATKPKGGVGVPDTPRGRIAARHQPGPDPAPLYIWRPTPDYLLPHSHGFISFHPTIV